MLNLSSDYLDTPDFYWDREEMEMLWAMMAMANRMQREGFAEDNMQNVSGKKGFLFIWHKSGPKYQS